MVLTACALKTSSHVREAEDELADYLTCMDSLTVVVWYGVAASSAACMRHTPQLSIAPTRAPTVNDVVFRFAKVSSNGFDFKSYRDF